MNIFNFTKADYLVIEILENNFAFKNKIYLDNRIFKILSEKINGKLTYLIINYLGIS